MKVLFAGPIFDFSGFAHASRNFLLALLENDQLEVVARPLQYDRIDEGKSVTIDPKIVEATKGSLTDIQMAIQMTTCNVEAQPVPGVVNGLYSFFESDRIPATWAQKANMFDFLLVPCLANALALKNSGVQKPIMVCPPPCNADEYRFREPYPIQGAENRTVFYNVCQLSQKKGIDALLRAYYAAFADCPDTVLLVLKCYIGMQDRRQDMEAVKQFIERIKQGCRLPIQKYPPVMPIMGTLSDEEIAGLHEAGDAYVCSSRGEGWGIPVFDALANGNTVISHKHGGLEMFVNEKNSLVYNGCITHAFDMPHSDPLLYTGLELWFEPSTAEMASLMRAYHFLRLGAKTGQLNEHNQKQWAEVLSRREEARKVGLQFDYRTVHGKIAEQLVHAHKIWSETGSVEFIAPAVEETPES